ncbi:hypothetical protein [Bradyrhizobium sp.]|uniref:hypothetical protein n=1 Tax=Bradyrhizobium sp. TaxID=376 RepID=UPI0026168BBB|nr:hypothetical protein [Bradyrhizobium sp.]
MKFRMYGMLTASLGAMVLLLTADQTFAASRGGFHGGAHLTPHHMGHFRHHRGQQQGAIFWPGFDDSFNGYGGYGPTGEAVLDGTQPLPGDISNSNAAVIPWDWAHRYPPTVVPSARPYVSSCGAETLTVPDAHGGTGQVNIVRCY